MGTSCSIFQRRTFIFCSIFQRYTCIPYSTFQKIYWKTDGNRARLKKKRLHTIWHVLRSILDHRQIHHMILESSRFFFSYDTLVMLHIWCINLHWLLGSTILVLGSDFYHSHDEELVLTPSPDSSPWHCMHLRLTDLGSGGSFHWIEHKARGFFKANKEFFVVPLSKHVLGLTQSWTETLLL